MEEDIFEIYQREQQIKLPSGQELAYIETSEEGEPLLFLHGMGSNKKAWAKNIHELKNTQRCIALDLPGYGASAGLKEEYTISTAARKILEFIELKNIQKFTLIGHSMGGHLSMELARLRPDRVKQMILVAPAGLELYRPDEIELIARFFTGELIEGYSKNMITKNFELNFFSMPEDARFMISDRLELVKDTRRYRQFCDTVAASTLAIISYNMMSYLPEFTMPVLVFFGTDDKLIPHHIVHPDEETKQIALKGVEALAEGRLILIEECGHFLQWEKADLFNEAALEFVA